MPAFRLLPELFIRIMFLRGLEVFCASDCEMLKSNTKIAMDSGRSRNNRR